jgi:hypothetical protein
MGSRFTRAANSDSRCGLQVLAAFDVANMNIDGPLG